MAKIPTHEDNTEDQQRWRETSTWGTVSSLVWTEWEMIEKTGIAWRVQECQANNKHKSN